MELFDDLSESNHQDDAGRSDWYYDGVDKKLQDLSYDGKCPIYRTTGSRRAAKTYLSPGRRLSLDHYYLATSSWASEGGETACFEPAGNDGQAGPLNDVVSQGRLTAVGRSVLGVIGKVFGRWGRCRVRLLMVLSRADRDGVADS